MADTRDARYADHEDYFRSHYRDTYGTGDREYSTYEPAYRSGFRYGTAHEHTGRSFDDLEPKMRRRHEEKHGEGTWGSVKGAARHAFDHGRGLRREQPGTDKAGTKSPSGSSETASGDPGSLMREGDEKRRRS